MDMILFSLDGKAITMLHALIILGVSVIVLLAAIVFTLTRYNRERSFEATAHMERAEAQEARVAELARSQGEIAGRLSTLAEMLSSRQSDMARAISERLDAVTHRVGEGLSSGALQTSEQLQKLEARLSVIDAAQRNIGALSEQVTSLQAILANKPARGAFGQGRMEAIVRDALPASAYAFQATLSNRSRPDCLINLPGDPRGLAVDAKFPLEAFEALRAATDPSSEGVAMARVRNDLGRHVRDVAEKYILPGETQDVALLFVPSEAIHAELHDRFEDVIQRAHRARVLIVSPSLLMLAIQVVQGLVRDAAMREQTHLIQGEVGKILEDVRRLMERVEKLKTHHAQVGNDLEAITTSAYKIERRGTRIEQMEMAPADAALAAEPQMPLTPLHAVSSNN